MTTFGDTETRVLPRYVLNLQNELIELFVLRKSFDDDE